MKTKHCNKMCVGIGSATKERVVECNLILDRLGLISVNEVTFIYTGIEVISQYCYCS